MRRKELSDEEFSQVRELREAGYSWLKIQEKAGIERRLARRAYNEWLQGRSLGELRQARVNVATEMLSEHVDSLLRLAQRLVSELDLPESSEEPRSANNVLEGLWQASILGQFYDLPGQDTGRRSRRNRRQNLKLLESLQIHTRENVRWQALDEWQRAWDDCRGLVDQLAVAEQNAIREALSEESGIQEELRELSRGQDASKWLAHVVLGPIWQSIRSGRFDPEHPEVSIAYDGVANRVSLPAMNEPIKRVVAACQRVAGILVREPNVRLLHAEAQTIGRAIEELEDSLDPLVLRPMILLSPRCRLCPA